MGGDRKGGAALGDSAPADVGATVATITVGTGCVPPSLRHPQNAAGSPESAAQFVLERGSRIGRYLVLEALGEGGMGVVYAAYDPKLDRKIALKFLHARSGGEQSYDDLAKVRGRERLLREAQALAQLSHPNVISAYDVGTFDGNVFVAMELVQGLDLKEWAAQETRSVDQIVHVMAAAGRGLAAAHKAGLIHRDIKPTNILLGDDGLVRVVDFGLARPAMLEPAARSPHDTREPREPQDTQDPREAGTSSQREPSLAEVLGTGDHYLDSPVTIAGAIVGTPGHIAPEQYLGDTFDELSDQFSYCVTLYKLLYGTRPHTGKTLGELRDKIVSGEVTPPPRTARVSAHLRRIVLRGLSVAPEDRFPSMDALLAELVKDPMRVRRRIAVVAVLCALLIGGIAVASGQNTATVDPCAGIEDKLVDVWDPRTRDSVETAFGRSQRPWGGDTFRRVRLLLDQRAQDWVEMRTDVCTATRVRADQSEQLMDLRVRCLDRRLSETRALTQLFADKTDGAIVDRAIHATMRLPQLEYCADTDALTAAVPPPIDPETRSQVSALALRLDQATALTHAGQYRDARLLAAALERESANLDYLPIRAQILSQLGVIDSALGDAESAEPTLLEAAKLAALARNDRLVATTLVELVWLFGAMDSRRQEAAAFTSAAEISVARVHDPVIRARLLHAKSVLLRQHGDLAGAQRLLQEALTIRMETLGAEHVLVASTLNGLGAVAERQGKFDAARALYTRSLVLAEKTLGPWHPAVGVTRGNLCFTLSQDGQTSAARQCQTRAVEILELALGSEHSNVAWARNDLGLTLLEQSEFGPARREFERAIEIWHKTSGPNHPDLSFPLVNLGDLEIAQKHYRRAITYCSRARSLREKASGAKSPYTVYHNTCLGQAYSGLHQPRRAIVYLERAIETLGQTPTQATAAAAVEFELARALWSTKRNAKRDRKRALLLAHKARAAYGAAGESKQRQMAEITAWLAKRVAR